LRNARPVSDFRVAFGWNPALRFERPHEVLRAATPGDAASALDRADRALRDGYWIAGLLDYNMKAVALGVFGPPKEQLFVAGSAPRISPPHPLVDRAAYDRAMSQIARSIYDGDVYQVNLTLPFEFAFDCDATSLYATLARRSGAPYAALLEDGTNCVLSCSPELFLAFDGDRISTKPMKGTALLDRVEDLASPKNRSEHVMIVDLLRNDLYRVCDDVTVEKLFEIERYPTFATMTSTIAGHLRAGTSLREIVRATFPCGSVTGAPKRAAMARIARLEPHSRGAYCGSIGFLSPQRRGWWNVAIRTAQLDLERGIGRYHAGGGIVADSRADDEWEEIAIKTQFIAELARPFDVRETFAGGDPSARQTHIARLLRTASAFGVRVDEHGLSAALDRIDAQGTLLRIRISDDGSIDMLTEPLHAIEAPLKLCISDVRVRSDDPMLAWKTSWRPAYERAAAYAHQRSCFDALLVNERGHLTEGSRTNLFVRLGDDLVTPPLCDGVFPGILRARLLAEGSASERSLLPDELRRARETFVGNSARGMVPAVLIEQPPA
jgi:para-aminobenzoate synthetase/4-amino-4-deoxychorismate lyase